ncbi:hypothetical protein P9D39_03725 [Heyndrickxia oleronia]|jgi:hypothetical protein|uniref:YqbQ/XkdQ domain-containing protein n=1 Tax=Heyndrickxia oleronia TaxID=38875 RepID=A0A8E2IA31_9BACI|nr:hypothetical protein [Heyndrickxia oleronia]MEC1373421.1 hypothetical protein [Heyndrickxia oleronia]OOP69531.1 hypothetical protein BWZ43_04630 [Heyndrickxia oleronia]QQZ04285.1 hypothetical protein I5818_21815 [Heyndrickxia oleronia]
MEILIDNRKGEVFDIPVKSFEWKTERIGKASSFEADMYNDKPLEFPVEGGAIIRATEGNNKIFYGFAFEDGIKKSGDMSIKAYDQLRYLKNQDTYVMPSSTATTAIKRIAGMLNLSTGILEDTKFVVPGIVEDEKEAFDVVAKFLDSTLIATNRNFILFDNFGKLDLRSIENLVIPADDFYIGDDSLLYDYEYSKSIDKETYNKIKFVRDNKKKAKRETFIAQDSANIKKWGLLQQFRKVDENMTDAQIKELVERSIKAYNKETKTLELSCLGNWKVRAGRMLYLYIAKLGIKDYVMIDECTHKWQEGVHTMDLKVKVV